MTAGTKVAYDVPWIMSHGGPILMAYEWTLFALSTFTVVARVYVQLRFRNRPWREILIIQAWLTYLAYTICDTICERAGYFNESLSWDDVTDHDYYPVLLAQLISWIVFPFTIYGCKVAFLLFYLDITPRMYFPKTWWAIQITFGCVIVGWLNHIFYEFLQFDPLACLWTESISCAAHYRTNVNESVWPGITWSLHLFTDIQVYLIPVAIMRNIEEMTLKDRRRCYVLFAIGFLNILSALGVSLTDFGYEVPENISAAVSDAYWFSNVWINPFQLGTAVIIVCLPFVTRMWRGVKVTDLRPGLDEELAAARAVIAAPAGLPVVPETADEETKTPTAEKHGSLYQVVTKESAPADAHENKEFLVTS